MDSIEPSEESVNSVAEPTDDPAPFGSSESTPVPDSTNRSRWKHADLLETEFPSFEWIVEGLVVDEGLTILGGKKKLGKSFLCLQMAQAVAGGSPFLGRKTTQGSVTYIALEDGPRRLNNRLRKQQAPAGLAITYVTKHTPLNHGGMKELEAMIRQERPRLIIIDTLASAKTAFADENSAGIMADLVNRLRELAQEHHVGIVLVAHHGKSSFGDPGHDIRGSSAIPGAADVNLGLYRTALGTTLMAEGRDIEEIELRVAFDASQTWTWRLAEDARQLAQSESEAEATDALSQLGEADAGKVADKLGKARESVQVTLKRMREEGRINWRQDGQRILYSLKD